MLVIIHRLATCHMLVTWNRSKMYYCTLMTCITWMVDVILCLKKKTKKTKNCHRHLSFKSGISVLMFSSNFWRDKEKLRPDLDSAPENLLSNLTQKLFSPFHNVPQFTIQLSSPPFVLNQMGSSFNRAISPTKWIRGWIDGWQKAYCISSKVMELEWIHTFLGSPWVWTVKWANNMSVFWVKRLHYVCVQD